MFAFAEGFLGVRPISGVSKERVTLWSGCIGLTVLAGFLGQRPKWDGAKPSPSGEPTTTEAKRVVIVGYIWASPASHRTTTEYRPKPRPALPELPCLCRSSLAAIRAVLRLAVASYAVLAGCSVTAVFDMRIFGCFRHERIGRCIAAVTVIHIG